MFHGCSSLLFALFFILSKQFESISFPAKYLGKQASSLPSARKNRRDINRKAIYAVGGFLSILL